ncbi:ABC transporter permease [Draconibacterium sp. IB214405]|uniref:ABC transporter permease n=1 Tax=Draconibacterium sp. IB214405 TaxID=3097352 RepID=UPI002A0DDC93|nr:ABC transporter permease [Draconibacterium sp. IB214405]MDX8337731.1 ABC transporter permease [Draconibacterium sp. IB214405]
MIRNYLTTALRFLKRNKLFAGINIMGLSLALAASFVILLFVINELSYNTCFKSRKQIYRVLNYNSDVKVMDEGAPYVLTKHLKDDFPQVKYVAPTFLMSGVSVKVNEDYIPVDRVVGTDSDIFDVFDIEVHGQQANILDEPNSIVLSKELAQKLFPDKDPVGENLVATINKKDEVLGVKGVFDDIPVNSTFQADCFIHVKWTLERMNSRVKERDVETDWRSMYWQTWLMLDKSIGGDSLDEQFRSLEKEVFGAEDIYDFSLQCLSDVYFGSQEINSGLPQGNLKNIKIFSAIALLIILIAALNYIILSTAVSTGRSKEIGIRKTNGAGAKLIRRQLLNESMILSILVLPVALFLAWMGKPYAEELFQTKLLILRSNIAIYICIYVVLTLLIGVVSGLYTSSYLSKLNVISILNNSVRAGKRKTRVRSALIVVQLVIFCIFVSSTLIIYSQYKYALEKDPGYYNEDVLFVDMGSNSQSSKTFINNIKAYPDVLAAGGAMDALPMTTFWPYPIEMPGDKSKKIPIELLAVDYNFLEAMGIQIIDGRGFSQELGDDENSYVINENAVKALELTDPVGKKIDVVDGTVIGVVKNFNLHSFHSEIPPLLMLASDDFVMQVAIHYKAGTLKSVLPLIKSEWQKIVTDVPMNFKTMDEFLKEVYSEEKNLSVIVSVSAFFALLIASFGLFGLTLFIMKSQTKEIGIKKVCGSSGQGIVLSFLRKNFIMVVIATLLSVPPTIFLMNKWLNNFAFKTDISWWVFVITFVFAAIVALSTVLFHSYRASRINPVEALRYE